MREKESLPSSSSQSVIVNVERRRRYTAAGYILLTLFIVRYCFLPIWIPSLRITGVAHHHDHEISSSCQQTEALYPQSFDVNALIEGNERRCIDWLSGAVKIPTEIFDAMGEIGEDPRWDAFYRFSECEYLYGDKSLNLC